MKYVLYEMLEDGEIVDESFYDDPIELLSDADKSPYVCEVFCQITHIYDYLHLKERNFRNDL